ncbi:unnamed protein product [Musa acuminata subsp. malaccensis]|uniref:(wild Malaysian banana) hypothetical protein n=1 Tax=Musa acuminata subsp. malaccensis TaxID=214687 RepID=A0A804J3Q8_MUSAM|nr:unnamed protein product [Musa acuminata subsp. malaccensis]
MASSTASDPSMGIPDEAGHGGEAAPADLSKEQEPGAHPDHRRADPVRGHGAARTRDPPPEEESPTSTSSTTTASSTARSSRTLSVAPAGTPAPGSSTKREMRHISSNHPLTMYRKYIAFDMQLGDGWGLRMPLSKRGESDCQRASGGGEKQFWQRYIYLCSAILIILHEELDAQDIDRSREVYRECLKLIPHKKFSFAKL